MSFTALMTLFFMIGWLLDARDASHGSDNAVTLPPVGYLTAEAARREFLGYGPGPWPELYETVAL